MIELYIKNDTIKSRNQIVINNYDEEQGYTQIFNPPHELLIENGWELYEVPQPKPIEITLEDQYKTRIIDLIREKYTIDDEIALLRQRDLKIDEFEEYNTYVEECKQIAHREIYE